MTIPMSSLLAEISREHFPYSPATPEEIAEFEQRVGWTLDLDMRAFYLHCNGAELIKRLPRSPCQVLPLREIVRARVAMRGEDDDEFGPASMYAICDVQDGNYVVADVSRQVDGRYSLIDGDHETWWNPHYCGHVANSFAEYLEGVLRTRNGCYWLAHSAKVGD
jgi:hypothetical protein